MESQAKAECKNFSTPDEVKNFPGVKMESVKVGGAMITRITFDSGWKWSTLIQPLVKTKSHEEAHFMYQLSGKMMIKMDDGTQFECGPGDVYSLPKGHDGWVIGDEPVVVLEFQGLIDHAQAESGK
jgi:mannose-6-phosphate isomerase-like protein (cupin superfamily)